MKLQMKLYSITTLAAIALIMMVATNGFVLADPPDVPAELAYMDAQLTIFLPRLSIYQDEYFQANGVYFQALKSVSIAPDGLAAADDIASHPTDQAAALLDMWSFTGLPVELGWSIQVDTYSGPKGSGYVVTVQTRDVAGVVWEKAVNVGPETWRAYTWLVPSTVEE